MAGVIFGWAHVDDQILSHGTQASLVDPLTMNSTLGITFGWLYWKFGLNDPLLAHITVDALNFVVVIPGYLSVVPCFALPSFPRSW
ncbi:MAG: CPBP family glutamic-type intramembrane protease [Gemmatimonadales bacterium]